MSIAHAEDPAGEAFLRSVANMKIGRIGKALDPDFEIRACLKAHQWIWSDTDARFFTTHDVTHSHSVLEYVMQFDAIAQFTDIEKTILCMAALLHDIGMQYNVWGNQPAAADGTSAIWQELGLPPTPVSVDELRQDHVKYGYALVRAEMLRTAPWIDRLRFGSGSSASKELLGWAATVAFAHSGPDVWPSLCRVDTPFVQDAAYPATPEQWRRPRLMAAVFRLADELHTTHDRVPDADRLWETDIEDLSRLHWLAAEFTSRVRVDVRSVLERQVAIVLDWREPENTDDGLRADITKLLNRMRIEPLTDAFNKVNEMFIASGRPALSILAKFEVMPTAIEKSGIAVGPRLREILGRQDQIIRQRVAPAAAVETKLKPAAAAVTPLIVEPRASIPVGTLSQELRTWFFRNISARGHFRVRRTGSHTDTLFKVRALVSERALVLRIAHHLRDTIDCRSVSLLVAVGTGCIPIATQLAMETTTPLTYTTHSGGGEVDGRELQRERQPIWEGREASRRGRLSGSVLILDDLVARGDTAERLIGVLLAETDVRASEIHYVSVFRFSSIAMRQLKETRYSSLCEIPEVQYAPGRSPDASTCIGCAAGLPLVDEIDAW